MQVHMQALNLATQRLAAAQAEQQQYHEGEIRATKMLHAAAAEVEVLRSVSESCGASNVLPPFHPLDQHSAANTGLHHTNLGNSPDMAPLTLPCVLAMLSMPDRHTATSWAHIGSLSVPRLHVQRALADEFIQ